MSQPTSTQLTVSDMHCASCVASVEKALNTVPGVESAEVNFATQTATVYGKALSDALVQAVIDAGYQARLVPKPQAQSQLFNIEGMHCAGCVASVEKAIQSVAGVEQANVNFANQQAEVSGQFDKAAVVEAVKQAGFSAQPLRRVRHKSTSFAIRGMHCAGCVASVEKAIQGVAGVEQASVNFANQQAEVSGQFDTAAVVEAVKQAGYEAQVLQSRSAAQPASDQNAHWRKESHLAFKRSALAVLLGVPLMVGEWLGWFPKANEPYFFQVWLTIAIVCLGILQYSGRRYYVGAWKQLWHGRANMDTLVALGTAAAWAYSMVVVFIPNIIPGKPAHLYFESALIILAFLNIGSALEAREKPPMPYPNLYNYSLLRPGC